MSTAAEDTTEQAAAASADAARTAADESFTRLLRAATRFVKAVHRITTTLLALFAAESRVLRASIALVFLCSVALVAFSVSLWACVVALIGWALMVATGSIGIALAILVVLHLILVGLLWFAIRRAVHHASFPLTRDELGMLGRELRRDVARFQHASTRRDPGAPP